MEGKMFAFEGTEGCGKSTVIQLVENKLNDKGYKTMILREPGGSDVGEDIRKIIFNPEYTDIDKTTELLLMLAIRNENYQNTIKPLLSEGHIILCDRYVDSTLVYQGYRYNDRKAMQVKRIIEDLFGFIFPPEMKKSFYLQLPDVKIGLERIQENHRNTNKFDEMDLEFHQKIKDSYDWLYSHGEKVNHSLRTTINANKDADAVANEILKSIEKCIK